MQRIVCIVFLFTMTANADSLFTMSGSMNGSFFSDQRAKNVGDIITVEIVESSSSSQSGATKLNNKSSMEAAISSLLYPLAAAPVDSTDSLYSGLQYVGSRLGVVNGTLPKSSWESDNDFEGDGSLSSKSAVSGILTAMIVEVLPNGNLVIEGKRNLMVDKQQQKIVLSGIVRPQDVSADNRVESQYIANAVIKFDGKGPINNFRRRGLLQRIWDFFRLY